MYKIYTSGPMSGESYEEATEWRKKVAHWFARRPDLRIETISPVRARENLSGSQDLTYDPSWSDPLNQPKTMYERDKFDVEHCDLMLVNLLGAQKVSIGTMVEIGWATALGKPIVVVIEAPELITPDSSYTKEEWEENCHEHIFIDQAATYRTNDLDDALMFIERFLP